MYYCNYLRRDLKYKMDAGFEKVTEALLKELWEMGYTILVSGNRVSVRCTVWFPAYVSDVSNFILGLDQLGCMSFEEPNVLSIEALIQNFEQWEVVGEVFVFNRFSHLQH